MKSCAFFVASLLFTLAFCTYLQESEAGENDQDYDYTSNLVEQPEAQARSAPVYFRNLTALADLYDRLTGPETFTTMVINGIVLNGGRTVILLFAGWVYRFLLNNSRGERREFIKQFDFYFNDRAFGINVGRNIRNLIYVILARVIINLFVYGPVATFNGFYSKSITELIDGVVSNMTTMTFTVGMFLETFGEVGAFLALAVIGNSGILGNNPNPTLRSIRSAPSFEESSLYDFAGFINEKFQVILADLGEQGACENTIYDDACSASDTRRHFYHNQTDYSVF